MFVLFRICVHTFLWKDCKSYRNNKSPWFKYTAVPLQFQALEGRVHKSCSAKLVKKYKKLYEKLIIINFGGHLTTGENAVGF